MGFGRKKKDKVKLVTPAQTSAAPPPQQRPVAHTSWDPMRFKIQLKMARSRIDIQKGKKENEVESSRRLIAEHLSSNKVTLARIHAERVIRERSQIRSLDVVETMVELLASANTIIPSHTSLDTAPGDLREATASVVYASSVINVPELRTVVDMLRSHFGPHVIDPLLRLEGPHVKSVNKMLASSLDGGPPDGYLVLEELTRVAQDHNINWVPPAEPDFLDVAHAPPGPSFPPPPPHGDGGAGWGMPPPPPPPSQGGFPGGGGGGGAYPAMNIPGGMGGHHDGPYDGYAPSAPPPPPPPGSGAQMGWDQPGSGSLYPDATAPPPPPPPQQHPGSGPYGGMRGGEAGGAPIMDDNMLEQRLQNMQGGSGPPGPGAHGGPGSPDMPGF